MPQIEINEKLITFALFLPVFFLSLAVHEFAHALSADRLGDGTPRSEGRLTLNPLRHLDLIGSLLMPLLSFSTGIALIGWAKPVRVAPANFKNPLRDDAIVSFAGPLSNFVLSLLFLLTFLLVAGGTPLPDAADAYLIKIVWYGMYLNIFLYCFNLLPIPPLDGSHIVYDLFPNRFTAKMVSMGLWGSIFLMLFIYSPLWQFFIKLTGSILTFYADVTGVLNAR